MKQRLATALIVSLIAAAVGIGVAIWQRQVDNMLAIAMITGGIGFFFGLVFKFRAA